ncbi:MAG: hypothetical protein PWQ34_1414 [Caldanaerobacter sp.]|uniref:Uncharacterized protein n=1 Tax=Caldanaerobacter subterraneus subsp. tengcongensis (strain DSM 15242 / JCM 11007 / NBRC 100824 / MB4) TaxID=273068 RepID=Q8RD40_CALS4|nr:hypothetical protein TTE0207 [Caldanaerobacter subterraneus subsp. tengcongensis MB4]MDI3519267.1 hypothetical protein [Caldanaerobacter sp.]
MYSDLRFLPVTKVTGVFLFNFIVIIGKYICQVFNDSILNLKLYSKFSIDTIEMKTFNDIIIYNLE